MKTTKWKSNATWPDGETSSDDHDTEAQARAACKILKRDGMGGLQEVFPTKTWVVARIHQGREHKGKIEI